MNTPSWSARCRLALVSICSLLAAAPPAFAEARVIFKSERSLVLRVRDLNGDGVRDLAYFFPDQRTQFDGPGRAEVQTQTGVILAQFRASGQHEVFALGANHPADIDDNQVLNSDDLTLLVQRAGQDGPAGIPGDVNFDGTVNNTDGALLMAALEEVDGLGWVRFDHRWPEAFEPDAAERDNCWVSAPGDVGFWACRPSDGDDPDGEGGEPNGTGPLGPQPGGGGGGPGGPGPGGDDCIGVEAFVTPSSASSHVTISDGRPTALTFVASGNPPGGAAAWSVSGAVVVHSDNSRCDVEVHEAGIVVVTATYEAPNGCTAEDTLELPAYSLDLSVDIDENGTIDDADIDAEGQSPGLILLANNFDEDGDGVEGFADGFDWNPLIEQDDSDDTTTFIPITLSVGGVESGNARIRIDYPASDPMALSIGDEGWTLPPGNLRLWKSDGSEPRNAELLIDGGHYIAPGEYTLADLGLFGTSEATLYVETVRESQAEGDIVIAAAVKEDEESDWVASDVVVGTGVRVETEMQLYGHDVWYPVFGFVSTHLHPPLEMPPADRTYGAWSIYRFVILDPRPGQVFLTVAGQDVPVARTGAQHESETFFFVGPEVPEDGQGHPATHLIPIGEAQEDIAWSMDLVDTDNSEVADRFGGRRRWFLVQDMSPSQRALETVIGRVVQELLDEGWSPEVDSRAPEGEYGVALHERSFQRIRTRGPEWYGSVWVDQDTRRIVRIGGSGPLPPGVRELDIVKMNRGINLEIGRFLVREEVEFACDIKSSVHGTMTSSQSDFYDEMIGEGRWNKLIPSHRWHRGANAVLNHTKRGVYIGLKSAGVAATGIGTLMTIHEIQQNQYEQQMVAAAVAHYYAGSDTTRFSVAMRMLEVVMAFMAYLEGAPAAQATLSYVTLSRLMSRFGYDGPPAPDFVQ